MAFAASLRPPRDSGHGEALPGVRCLALDFNPIQFKRGSRNRISNVAEPTDYCIRHCNRSLAVPAVPEVRSSFLQGYAPGAHGGLRESRPRLLGVLAEEFIQGRVAGAELAAGIQRVKSAQSIGDRSAKWPSPKHAQALASAPDIATPRCCATAPSSPCCSALRCAGPEGAALTDGCSSGGFTPEATVAARHANTRAVSA